MKKLDRNMRRRIVFYILTVALAAGYLFAARAVVQKNAYTAKAADYTAYTARVLTAEDMGDERYYRAETLGDSAVVTFTAEILSGDKKGVVIEGEQQMEAYYSEGRKYVEAGDKILVMYADGTAEAGGTWQWLEFVRTDALLVFGALFCAALIAFGRGKGVNTLVALAFTCAAVFLVFIPAILGGRNPYGWSVMTCFVITLVTLLIVSGPTKKCLVAGLGCFCGVLTAGLLFWVMDAVMHLTGVLNDESVYLLLLETSQRLDLKGIVFAGVLIGAVGAIMDVAMSITASLFELQEKTGGLPAGELIRSGLSIGRDIMGTMANTLVLAYIGCDLALVMLFIAFNTSLVNLLNRELIITEVVQSLTGSFGILMTIPLASIICAAALCGRRGRACAVAGASPAAPARIEGLPYYGEGRANARHMDSRPGGAR